MLHSSLHNSISSSSQYEALLELISVVEVGGWEYNLHTTELSWTDVTRAIHEVDADFVPDVSSAINFYYGEHTKKSISNAFETLLEKGTSYDLKLQIKTAKGNFKYVRSIGKAGYINGKIIRAYGSFQDITVETESEKDLEKALNDLQNIMASSLDVICVVNRDGNYVQVNAAVEKIWGYTVEEMLQKNVAEMVFEEVRTLPEFEMREVLDFVGFLKSRHGIPVAQSSKDAPINLGALAAHARELITEPTKTPDLALMTAVRGKVRMGATWTRDELYDRCLR